VSELDDATHVLERLTRDPMADAVPGLVRVVSASEPASRGRYQECRLELIAEAPGIPHTTVATSVVTRPQTWPRVGMRLPARISVSRPTAVEVDWDALAR
jgi:hypothetical protein